MIIWKPIPNYEGIYEVSSNGLIRVTAERMKKCSRMKSKEGLMATYKDKDGYDMVLLMKNGVRFHQRVSRAVCAAFHENPENKPVVNHKNGVKGCNWEWNLEWATLSENELHSYRVLGKKPKGPTGLTGKLSKTSKPLYQCDMDGNLLKTWDSMADAIRAGFGKKEMQYVIKGVYKQHKNFIWKR